MKAMVVMLLMSIASFAQNAHSETSIKMSPAEESMAIAMKLIDKNPNNFDAYNALAFALSRRARETSDVTFYTRAEEALQKSFAIAPANSGAERIEVWLLLGKHEFAKAREAARKLSQRIPGDIMTYGFLTDANVEVGNYDEAEKAAQKMLDLKAGNMPGVTRAAYLRELFGDLDGSLELMQMAYESTPQAEVEDRAWILTQIAHLDLASGRISGAEQSLNQALDLFPGYHYALANLAKVRILQKRYIEAVSLLDQRYRAAPHAENLFDLAHAMELAGRKDDARKAYAEFEQRSLVESAKADNSNHELTFYYANVAREPAKALEVARRELARRHDVFTLDAYAWALFVNGQYGEARRQSERALQVGIRDATLLRHAGEIALKCGDQRSGEKYLRASFEVTTIESEPASVFLNNSGHASMER
jgi:tetratricopeptide (TPR) repeat protein